MLPSEKVSPENLLMGTTGEKEKCEIGEPSSIIPEKKNELSTYVVGSDDTLTSIAYYHKMSINYLLRLNGLGSDAMLLPGTTLKVIKRDDFTIGKDIEEESKPKTLPVLPVEAHGEELRNNKGEISNLAAISSYLSKEYKKTLEMQKNYRSDLEEDKAQPEKRARVQSDFNIAYSSTKLLLPKEKLVEKENITTDQLELIASSPIYTRKCHRLTGAKNSVEGTLEISKYVIMFTPQNERHRWEMALCIDICSIVSVSCYSIPRLNKEGRYESHYCLLITLMFTQDRSLPDSILLAKQDIKKSIKVSEEGEKQIAVCFELGVANVDLTYPVVDAILKLISRRKNEAKQKGASFKSTSVAAPLLSFASPDEATLWITAGEKVKYVEERQFGFYQAMNCDCTIELRMAGKSEILSSTMRRYLRCSLPLIKQFQTWELIFDINKDGISTITFFYNTARHNPTLLLVEDTNGNVFGVYASEIWKQRNEFYGTGESYVFSFKDTPYIRVYRWARKKEMFLFSDGHGFGAGGGGEFSLFINDDFSHGSCGKSETFENELLSDRHFTIRRLEIWGISLN